MKKKSSFFILGVSNSECLTCCQTEPLLKRISEEFEAKNYNFKGRKIPVIRVDMAKDSAIFEKEGILFEQVPKITFYHDGVVHGFENGIESMSRFIFNINRLLTPLHSLKNEQEINEFFAHPDKVFSKEYLTPFFKKAKD